MKKNIPIRIQRIEEEEYLESRCNTSAALQDVINQYKMIVTESTAPEGIKFETFCGQGLPDY